MPGFGDLSGPRDPQNAPLGDYEADRDAELREQLAHSPALLGEVALSDEEAAEAARFLRTDDAVGFMALYRAAVKRHIGEQVEVWQYDRPCLSEAEAVEQLAGVYA